MKKCNKFLSLLLAVLMLCSVLTCFSVTIAAEEETTAETETEAGGNVEYLTQVFATPDEKLATMRLKLTKGDYSIYCDETSGEVAVKNNVTGQILSTNPYDVGSATASDSIKYQLLSQIIIKYTDNGKEKEFSSYEYASLRDQITVKNIKNGIRVEYIIGREEARHLVPRQIEDSRFREKLLAPMMEYYDLNTKEGVFWFSKFLAYYSGSYNADTGEITGVKSKENCATDTLLKDLLNAFPICDKMDIWVCDPTISSTEVERLEEMIKAACPEYSYEEMDYDHQLTEYESSEANPPVFKMALEYTLDEDGFTVRLPVNGLTYNESLYQLTNISILPYMGCGNNAYEGYVFYPDGSGTLFSLEDLVNVNTTSVSSKVYGADYAYHQLTGTYQQTVRYPVFGVVENTQYYDCVEYDDSTGDYKTTRISGLIYDKLVAAQKGEATLAASYSQYNKLLSASEINPVINSRGYAAIIEEGDALTNLVYYHSGVLAPYDTVMMNFNPRPQDSYNLAESISVGTNSEWTVTTDRKYTGNFKVHYIMLTDASLVQEKGLENDTWYDTTWLGMAFAYRSYLENKGILTRLTEAETANDIPLYIETFGSLYATERIASIPVSVKKALTSAADIITMYEELSDQGVTNINFKLTGYANGGMYPKMPYNLKWERSVSKDVSMQELFDYAANVSGGEMGIYPEFDFSYVMSTGLFDGLSMRKHLVKTIDDRYASKREYIATQQRYGGYYQMAISPAYFSHFYTKFINKYLDYDNVTGISVGSLGSALNSDFDEDEPYNREDARTFVKKALEYLSGADQSNLSVMVDGGNVYTWQYVDHILDVSLDSSRYIKSSYSVPFVGVVLHGYMNFAGSPLNMEGDIDYAKLKAIENGASLYFTLSYANTELLKEDDLLSKYYSIRYDIWQDDLVDIYNEVNGVLKDVQNKLIIDHEFLSGMRVPDTDELENDILAEYEKVLDYQTNKEEYEIKQQKEAVADARKNIASLASTAETFIETCLSSYSGINGCAYLYVTGERSFERRMAAYVEADAAYKELYSRYEAASDEEKESMAVLLSSAETTQKQALAQLKTYVRNISRIILSLENEYEVLSKLRADAESGALLVKGTEGVPESIIAEIDAQLAYVDTLMQEKLGIKFDLTVDKAEVDTFLYTHISNLILGCYGTDSNGQVGIYGKAENIYDLLVKENYGLLYSEVDLLRYLDANRSLSDAEIIAKYGLEENATSVTGLIKYMRELLGESYTFDPILSDDQKDENGLTEIDANILGYFVGMLYTSLSELSDTSTVPTLNFVTTRINESGREVSNATNVNNAIKSVNNVITSQLTDPAKGKVAAVTDGNYKLDHVVTDAELNEVVAACVAAVQAAIDVTDTSKRVEYATPDTMETDVRAYVIAKYYRSVLSLVKPDNIVDTLEVMTVSYKTDTTVARLASNRLAAYGELIGFKAAVDTMEQDTVISEKLHLVADRIKNAYGDTSDDLMTAYVQAYAAQIVSSVDSKSKPTFDFKDDGFKTSDVTALNEEMYAFVTEAVMSMDSLSTVGLSAIVDQLVEKLNEHTLPEGTDVRAEAEEFVYFVYLTVLSELKTSSFYYDEQMADMDAAVRAAVAEGHDRIAAKMTEGTSAEVYDLILADLGNIEKSVASLTADIASKVTYHISGNYTMQADVQSYYIYLLFDSFSEYMFDGVPTLTLYDDEKVAAPNSTKYNNAIKFFNKDYVQTPVTELVAAARTGTTRGEVADYSLTRVKPGAEMDQWVEDVFKKLEAGQYLESAVKALGGEDSEAYAEYVATLHSEIEQYIRYYYYTAVLDKLNASRATTFHVSEVYGKDLYTASEEIKSLLRYYVTNMTDMTEQDIDDMIKTGTVVDNEEEEDPSKYLSADGRIVAVTYGDKTANGSYTAYKTFLLNYNNFSVSVVYDEITYTIPAYGYVVIMR